MNRDASLRVILALVVLAASPIPDAFASEPKAARLRSDASETPTYSEVGGNFVKGPVASSVGIGNDVIVVDESPRGYVLVAKQPKAVWLDKMDVKMLSGKAVKARCLTSVTTAADTTAALTRGAGEGCKK